jgi:hypothetical protein
VIAGHLLGAAFLLLAGAGPLSLDAKLSSAESARRGD